MILREPFRGWPIRRKLTFLFLVAGFITAVAVSVPMGAFDFLSLRGSMTHDLDTLPT